MNKSIYIRDEGLWDRAIESIGDETVSCYLMRLIAEDLDGKVDSQLDRIEGKLDELLKEPRVLVEQSRMVASKGPMTNAIGKVEQFDKLDKLPELQDALIEVGRWPMDVQEGQTALDSKRKGRDIKKEKIIKSKVALSAMPFFKPNPKGK